jgi:hypothetical protein
MTPGRRDRQLRPADVDPGQLIEALRAAGWHVAGARAGVYTRLYWPGETAPRGRTLLILEDTTAPEFDQMMGGALRELADAADTGRAADAVLDAVAGARPVDPAEPSDLDDAMWTVWLESGKWRWTTSKMTTEVREAAVAAVLRYDRWMKAKAKEPADHLLKRERLAWWD